MFYENVAIDGNRSQCETGNEDTAALKDAHHVAEELWEHPVPGEDADGGDGQTGYRHEDVRSREATDEHGTHGRKGHLNGRENDLGFKGSFFRLISFTIFFLITSHGRLFLDLLKNPKTK